MCNNGSIVSSRQDNYLVFYSIAAVEFLIERPSFVDH